ncbi:MAG TPA: YecR family lipoprotein [Steroidobacteraceae bacterium]|jgi:hypothetical protein|nr:YecR family lipoprotein [Steroidobacteraceae bacterium]
MRALIALVLMSTLAACATTGHEKWSAAGGNRQAGVVRVSYDYPEFHQPTVSDAQAAALALNRCNTWGYKSAEPIAGQIRECANTEDGNCNLWTVTREFQCKDATGSYANRLSR